MLKISSNEAGVTSVAEEREGLSDNRPLQADELVISYSEAETDSESQGGLKQDRVPSESKSAQESLGCELSQGYEERKSDEEEFLQRFHEAKKYFYQCRFST